MNWIVLIDKCIKYIKRKYYNYVFRKSISAPNTVGDPLIGEIILINQNIRLGDNVHIYPGVLLWGAGMIEIGSNVDVGKDTVIYASKNAGVIIGNDTQIAAQCFIIDMDHGHMAGVSIRNQQDYAEKVVIGSDVWIGAGAKILKGTQIGDGAIIGAGAIVKGNIAANAIAVGCPAQVIGYRK